MAKTNYTQFIWLFTEAFVQNGVSGGYIYICMHDVFKPAVQQEAEIWTSPPRILPREAYYSCHVSRIYVASL